MPSFLTLNDLSEEDYLQLRMGNDMPMQTSFVGFGLLENKYIVKKCYVFGGRYYAAFYQTYSNAEGERTFFCFQDQVWWQAKNYCVEHLKKGGEPFFATQRGGQWCLK